MPGADRIAIGKRRRSSGRFFAAKGCGAEYRGRGSEHPKAHRAESTGDFEQPVVSGGYLPVQYRDSVSLMEQLVRIAGQAGIYEVIRQSDKDTLHEVVTKILQFC